jgi:actin cytoskeleton-regulatory complex protein PAN1
MRCCEIEADMYRQSRPEPPRRSSRDYSREENRPTNGDLPSRLAANSTSSASSVPGGGSTQDRVASAKEKALKRIQERMAAAGLKPAGDAGESPAQRAERERQERAERVRKAEAEDARREQERQQRLANEGVTPASPKTEKKPPPPAPRKQRQDSSDLSAKKAAEVAARQKEEEAAARAKAEEEAAADIRAEQAKEAQERERLEYVQST